MSKQKETLNNHCGFRNEDGECRIFKFQSYSGLVQSDGNKGDRDGRYNENHTYPNVYQDFICTHQQNGAEDCPLPIIMRLEDHLIISDEKE